MSVVTEALRKEITIIYNGEERPLAYKPHETVHAALEQALNLYEITTNRHLMALFTASGEELTNEQQSLEAVGVKAEDELTLGQSKVRGGS